MKRLIAFLIALSVLAGCSQQPSHSEGDGHDHGSNANPAAGSGQKPADEHGHAEEGHADEPITLSAEQAAIANVSTEKAARTQIQPGIVVPGTVSSTTSGRAVVTPPVSGRVVRVSISLGQTVRRGQVLAVLESTELAEAWSRITEAVRSRDEAAARVKDGETQVQLAESRLSASKQTLARQRDFAAAGAFNQAPLQQAQSDLNDAQSELLSAQREQATHSEQLRRMENLFRDGLVSKSDLESARLEVQQDEIKVDRASAKVQAAKATFDREKRIADRGLLDSKEVQTAEAEVRSARIELDRSRGVVRSSRAMLATASRAVANAQTAYRVFSGGGAASGGRVNLVSPLYGVVTRFDVTRGQAVDRTQALFEIENLAMVWATAQVPERDSAKVKKDQNVTVTTAALPGVSFEGIVEVVASRIDPKTRTLAVQCRLANGDLRLKPEMFVEVRIAHGQTREALTVPSAAIVSDAGKTYVFVKDGEAFTRHEVKTGVVSSGRTEILSGIEEGEAVAVEGAFILKSQLKRDELKGHEH